MILGIKKYLVFLSLIFVFLILFSAKNDLLFAQTETPTPTPDTSQDQLQLQNQIKDLQTKIVDLQGQEKTLSSQIAVMDSQIKLTQLRIDATKQQIEDLIKGIETTDKKISKLEADLDALTKVLLNRITATYEAGTTPPFYILLSSSNVSDFFTKFNYLKIAQAHDRKLVFETQQAKNDYSNQKNIFEDKKKKVEALKSQLEAYTAQLDQEKQGKEALLTETQGSETIYQKLLSQAQAQLASFASFVDTQGATILSNQTTCDDWGCYYNQRDSQWASILINNRNDCKGPCNILRVGCLVTSLSMVMSHLGHRDISPSDIALSDSSNFSVGTADLNKGIINVKGLNITRTTIAGSLDPSFVQSGPIIVGVNYGPFGTHFVVIKSYTSGNYIMNDPYTEGGKDKVFTDYYSLGSVFEIDRVSL